MRRSAALALTLLALSSAPAYAQMPLARPVPAADIEPGRSAPFVGAWSMTMPATETDAADTEYATCTLPVRIEAATDTHIFYLGPRETEAEAATELIPDGDGTRWEPIAGGPVFFTVWIDADTFYLYDQVPQADADWGMPFVYRRC